MLPSVGVVLSFRNRDWRATQNLFRTLENQTVKPAALVLVNFGEACPELERIPSLSIPYIHRHLPQPELWSRCLALNQGFHLLPPVDTVLFTDADMLFAPNFIEWGAIYHEDFPNSILNCCAYDLPKGSIDETTNVLKDFERLKRQSTPRSVHQNGACMWLPCDAVGALRGLDEEFKLWGCEDGDFHRRAIWHGLAGIRLDPQTCFLHQWHPGIKETFAGNPETMAMYETQLRRNKERLDQRLRAWEEDRFEPGQVNPHGWGELPMSECS
jgi:hypothetical protein